MAKKIAKFFRREDGGITALSLQMVIGTLVLGGLAIDFANGQATKTQLLLTADAAAQAALVTREWDTSSGYADSKAMAIKIAMLNMPPSKYGTVLQDKDILFGDWDADKDLFTPDPDSKDAVYVRTRRESILGNGLVTYMMGTTRAGDLDVNAGSVFETYYPTCFREGVVAQDVAEMQSNSEYKPGFCIHSQTYVSVNSNNTFDPGTVVSMPDVADISLPSSGYDSNTGLKPALRSGAYNLKILKRLQDIYNGIMVTPNDPQIGVMSKDSPYYRDYITSSNIVTVKAQGATTLDPSKFLTGRIHYMECKNDKSHKQIGAGFTLDNMILVTDCRLQFGSGAEIQNSVIFTINTDPKSLYAASDFVIGKDDNCSAGGGVQMVTYGGIDFAAQVSIYGSQVLALGDIALTANADGIEGASIVAGGRADITSNGAFGFCGGAGMENNYEAAYFRMAR